MRPRASVRSAPDARGRPNPPGVNSDWMTVGIGLLLLLFAANLLCWLIGQLASLLFGGGWPHATPTQVDLVRLLRDPGDPGAAWPVGAIHRPSPAGFWVTAVLLGGVAFTAGWRGLAWYEQRRRHQPGDRSSWAKAGDLDDLYVPDPTSSPPWWLPQRLRPERSNRLILGRFGRRLIAAEGVQGACILGPTRSQKTVGFIVTTLLERLVGPVVTTSVKPDVLRATLDFRRELGRVWVFDPKESTGLPTAHWSPLTACLRYEGAKEMALALVSAAQLEAGGREGAKFWDLKASQLLAPVLFAAAHTSGRMLTAINWLRLNKKDPVVRALESVGGSDAREALNEFHAGYNTEARLKSNIAATALGVLDVYTTPSVAKSAQVTSLRRPERVEAGRQARERRLAALRREETRMRQTAESTNPGQMTPAEIQAFYERAQRVRAEREDLEQEIAEEDAATFEAYDPALDFDPDQFLDGHNTLYLCAPEDQQEQLAPLFQALIMEVYRTARTRAHASRTGRLALPLLLLLDETGNVAPLRQLDVIASTGVGRNIQLVTVWHNLGQMFHRYGRDVAMTILNNLWAKVVLAGVSCTDTAEYFSTLVGREEIVRWGITRQPDGRRSASESITERQLAPPEGVRQIKPGAGILVYRDLPAVALRLRPWYEDWALVDKVNPDFARQECEYYAQNTHGVERRRARRRLRQLRRRQARHPRRAPGTHAEDASEPRAGTADRHDPTADSRQDRR